MSETSDKHTSGFISSIQRHFNTLAYNVTDARLCFYRAYNSKKPAELERLFKKYESKLSSDKEQPISQLLLSAAAKGDLPMAKRFLEMDANINFQDEYWKETPIMKAMENDHTEMVDFLKTRQPDLSLKDKNGRTLEDRAKISHTVSDDGEYRRRARKDNNQMTSPAHLASPLNIFNPLR